MLNLFLFLIFSLPDFRPRSIDELPQECKKAVLDYLDTYESDLDDEVKTAHFDGLVYGFRWAMGSAVERWLKFWLSALADSDFQLAEQVVLLGSQYGEMVRAELETERPFDELFTSIIRKTKQNLEKKSQELTSKERQEWWREVRLFCESGLRLKTTLENHVLYLRAGKRLLTNFIDHDDTLKRYLRFCERKKIKGVFVESPQAYLWFLIEVYISDLSNANIPQEYLKEFVTYPAETASQWGRLVLVHFLLDSYEQALNAVEEVLKRVPDDAAMLNNSINLLINLKRYERAKAQIEEILSTETYKDSFHFKLLKGKVLNASDESVTAEAWLRALLEDETLNDESKTSIWTEIAETTADDEKRKEALKQAVSLDLSDFDAASQLMMLYIMQDRQDTAEQTLQHFTGDEISKTLLQANFYLNTGKEMQGLQLLRELKTGADSDELLLLEAHTHIKNRSYRKALGAVGKFLKSEPDHLDALWLQLEARIPYENASEQSTINKLEKAGALTGKGCLRIAKLYRKHNDLTKALSWLDKIEDETDKTVQFFSTKGQVLHRLGKDKEALQLYQEGLRLHREEVELYVEKGASHLNLKEYEGALNCINRAIDLQPAGLNMSITAEPGSHTVEGLSILWFLKERSLSFLDRYEEALDAINHAIELKPKDSNLWYRKSYVLSDLEKHLAALDAVNHAIELDPKKSLLWDRKGQILWHMRAFQESLEYIEEALRLDANDTVALEFKAALLIVLGREAEAASCFDHFLEVGGEEWKVPYVRGCVYAVLGRHEEALAALKEVNPWSEELREQARASADFDGLRDMEEFQRLVNSNEA